MCDSKSVFLLMDLLIPVMFRHIQSVDTGLKLAELQATCNLVSWQLCFGCLDLIVGVFDDLSRNICGE